MEADGELQTTALEIEDDKVTAIYVVRDPDKLKHLHQSPPEAGQRKCSLSQSAPV